MKKILFTMLLIATVFSLKAQNVGIGTTTPADKLHIVIGNNASGGLLIGEASKKMAFLGDSTTTNENVVLRLFNNTEVENVRIAATNNSWLLGGNLGIGTNAPSAKLHVLGAFRLEDGSEAANRLMTSSINGTATWTDPSAAGLVLGSGAAGRLAYWQSSDSITSSSKLFWDNTNSSLGIGNSTPSEKLDIVLGASESGGLRVGESSKMIAFLGDSTTTSENGVLRLYDNAQTETVRLGANTNSFLMGGSLGIGTTSPTNELTINSASPAIQLQNTNVSKGYLSVSGDDLLLATNNGNTGSIRLKTSGNDRLSVNSSGLIGIGTITPNSILTIRGLDPQIQLQGNSGTDRGFLNLTGTDVKIGTNSGNTGKFIIRTDGGDRLAVDNNGNVGIGTNSPGNRLDVTGSTTGYVQHIENTNYQGGGLVISIQSQNQYGPSNNFIGFRHWNGSGYYTNGCIEGFKYSIWDPGHISSWCEVYDMIGIPGSITDFILAYSNAQIAAACMDDGVRYQSTGADYAEWLPREDPSKKILPASVVGVKNGKISYVTEGADQVMAISTRAVVLGNMPQEGKKSDYETVAFIGQVQVWVLGDVNAGDYIVASGKNNGVAAAVSPDHITVDDMKNILGRSWETKKGQLNLVNTVVGLKNAEYATIIKKQIDKTKQLEEQVTKIMAELDQLRESQAKDMEQVKKALNLNVRN